MATATTILAEVRAILDEDTAAQWSDVNLRRWINEANRDLARSTRHIKEQLSIDCVAGTASYSLAATTLAVEHAWLYDGDRHYALEPQHMENMDAVRGRDWSRAGNPMFYSTQGFAPSLTILVHPVPTSSDHDLIIYVSRLPVEIATDGTDDTDVIEIPQAWYDAIADYVEFKALRRDRDPRWQEAFQMYTGKRDALINNPDYLPINRGMIADPVSGYLPEWLVEFD